jgi:hypothetical protein
LLEEVKGGEDVSKCWEGEISIDDEHDATQPYFGNYESATDRVQTVIR